MVERIYRGLLEQNRSRREPMAKIYQRDSSEPLILEGREARAFLMLYDNGFSREPGKKIFSMSDIGRVMAPEVLGQVRQNFTLARIIRLDEKLENTPYAVRISKRTEIPKLIRRKAETSSQEDEPIEERE